MLSETISEAAAVLRGPLPGPAFIEIPHDFFHATVSAALPEYEVPAKVTLPASTIAEINAATLKLPIPVSRRCFLVLVWAKLLAALVNWPSAFNVPFLPLQAGRECFPRIMLSRWDVFPASAQCRMFCSKSDLLISFGARLTEFDTGRFGLKLPPQHIQVVEDAAYPGDRIPSARVVGDISAIARALAQNVPTRTPWCDIAEIKAREAKHLEALGQESYAALKLLRASMHRNDVLANDQSILNYWASAFFPVFEPGTFLYPSGSGTLGYGLPAAIGAACAVKKAGENRRVVCIAGDGGFQYTQHELATLAPVCAASENTSRQRRMLWRDRVSATGHVRPGA